MLQKSPSLSDLHRRLLAGDKTAADSIYIQLLEPLQRRLPGRDEANKFDAVTDALFDLIKRPGTFDPNKGQIEAFLLRAARCNLLNLQRGDHRRRIRETAGAQLHKNNVELRRPAGKLIAEAGDIAFHRRLLAALDPADRPVAELQRRGERQTSVFAEALGMADLPPAEQTRNVKRAKDRVSKTRLRLKG